MGPMGFPWEWELRRGNGKKSPHTVPIASCAIHGNSWAVNGSQSCESCIQLLAKCCVCQHLQLPARDYLHRHPLIASPAGHHWGAVPVSFVSASKPLQPSKTMLSGLWSQLYGQPVALYQIRFSVVTVTDYCKIYLSRRESNGTKCECQGRRRRTAPWLSRLVQLFYSNYLVIILSSWHLFFILLIHFFVSSLAFFNVYNTVGW